MGEVNNAFKSNEGETLWGAHRLSDTLKHKHFNRLSSHC